MSQHRYLSDEEVGILQVAKKRSFDPKDLLIIILIISVVAVSAFWYLSSREVSKLQEEKMILIQRLIISQEKTTERIEVEAGKTDTNIWGVEARKRKAEKDEKEIIDSYISLDVVSAQEFLTNYKPTSK